MFSNFGQINEDGSPDDSRFDERNGWVYDEATVDGRWVLQCHALEAYPHNVSYIWFAPNHVRAFRKSVYETAGGYDATGRSWTIKTSCAACTRSPNFTSLTNASISSGCTRPTPNVKWNQRPDPAGDRRSL